MRTCMCMKMNINQQNNVSLVEDTSTNGKEYFLAKGATIPFKNQ